MKIVAFLMLGYVSFFSCVCAMEQQALRSADKFVYQKNKGYITQRVTSDERAQRRRRENFVKQLTVEQSLKESIRSLPLDVHNLIARYFVYNKQAWYQKDLEVAFAWGSLLNTKEKKARIFLSNGDRPAFNFYNIFTGKHVILSLHYSWINTAFWNANNTQLLTASNDRSACLWDGLSGKCLAKLWHDYRILSAFFIYDAQTLSLFAHMSKYTGMRQFASIGDDNVKIVTCERIERVGEMNPLYVSHTWEPYNFTIGQAVIYKLLYTWLLVKKPKKGLVKTGNWDSTAANDLLTPYINSIENIIGSYASDKNVVLKTWKTIPSAVRENIWLDIRTLILRYGK